MMPNFLWLAIAALIPLIIGFVWYNPKVFGNAWMKSTGLSQESMKGANMALIFGLTYVFSYILAFGLQFSVIHQFHVFSLIQNQPGFGDDNSEVMKNMHKWYDQYAHNFRTYKHGALHGSITAVFLLLPIITVNALFERRGFKYIAITAGYWIVSCMLMGAVICHWT